MKDEPKMKTRTFLTLAAVGLLVASAVAAQLGLMLGAGMLLVLGTLAAITAVETPE
jgi:hypothetical protein